MTPETFMLIGTPVLLGAVIAVIASVRRRPRAVIALEPQPMIYRSIRVLHNDDEIRDAARRAYERESFIADAADRRAARLDRLTRGA